MDLDFDSSLIFVTSLGSSFSFIHSQTGKSFISLMYFFLHLKKLLFGNRLGRLNLNKLLILDINRFLSEFLLPFRKPFIQCHILLLHYPIDLLHFFIVSLSCIHKFFLHFLHVILHLFHDLNLHLYLHFHFFLTHLFAFLGFLVISLFFDSNQMVLSDFLFRLFCHLLILHICLARSIHFMARLFHLFILRCSFLLQNPDNFWT